MIENFKETPPPAGQPAPGRGRFRWSWTLTLIAIYVLVLLVQHYVDRHYPADRFIFNNLALSCAGIAHGYAWQFLTYQFLHGGWIHMLFNSWVIYVFGSELEGLLGGRRYLSLVLACGIVGGVFQVFMGMCFPTLFGGSVVGASACAFGLVAAFASLYPEEELTILVLFVIPVQVPCRFLLIFSAVIALMGLMFPWNAVATYNGAQIANAAHLGGMAMGWYYVKKIMKHPALPAKPDPCLDAP